MIRLSGFKILLFYHFSYLRYGLCRFKSISKIKYMLDYCKNGIFMIFDITLTQKSTFSRVKSSIFIKI